MDLPGVHDSNAARAAVAEGYIKRCTGLWIVAPIIRAVDDKSAKKLLGETFKRQLKMDGTYNAVSFICSKTDDISLSEASEGLGLEEEHSHLYAEMDAHSTTQSALKKQLNQALDEKKAWSAMMTEADEELDAWDDLKAKAEEGDTVYAPEKSQKRKRGRPKKSNKRQKPDTSDSDGDYTEAGSESETAEEESDNESEVRSPARPVTEEDITNKIADLKGKKKAARSEKQALDENTREIRKKMAEAKEAEQKIQTQIARVCIAGRNEYSKGAIQLDFAAGFVYT